ncbi:disulfide bond formation protein DsbA [candidate division WWE3 bacterium]|jgi:protein-disulfide isomerase|uniref:Disulfide bond formation protein DsbA n=1 Tax=candidate division WWE3 bacterium TaxID=2053526 RepID=A0A3A4ZAE9_UNCKA|nr:MAG: disulfide bond formation protein DsbA [candidate division WWE3 bacterium]
MEENNIKEITKKLPNFITGNLLQVVLVVMLIGASFAIGSLSTKVRFYEKSGATPKAANLGANNAPTPNLPSQPQEAGEVKPINDKDHIRGNNKARIALIEYSDLECPFCKRFHPTAQQVVDAYKDDVVWVYRHFPLDQLHSKADKEAEATECAYKLAGNDGFWKLADKIFEVTPANNGLDLATLPDLAAGVGLNKQSFQTCLDSGEMAAHVEEDYQSGVTAGVNGTPGNILLDTKTGKTRVLPGAVPFDMIKQAIDEMLKS